MSMNDRGELSTYKKGRRRVTHHSLGGAAGRATERMLQEQRQKWQKDQQTPSPNEPAQSPPKSEKQLAQKRSFRAVARQVTDPLHKPQ